MSFLFIQVRCDELCCLYSFDWLSCVSFPTKCLSPFCPVRFMQSYSPFWLRRPNVIIVDAFVVRNTQPRFQFIVMNRRNTGANFLLLSYVRMMFFFFE